MSQVIRVATWNVNSLRTRLTHVLDWIDANNPDILCLQETKVEDSLFPTEEFTKRGLNLAMHGQKSYNGVALISRHALHNVTNGFNAEGLPEIFASQTRLIAATLNVSGRHLRIVSAYVPNGESPTSEKFTFKEEFYRHLTAYAARALETTPDLVICGDFNIAADERDIANPERSIKQVLFTPQEREWLSHFRDSNNFTDAFRQLSEEPNMYSWYDYRTYGRNPNTGARIDYLFASQSLKPHITAVEHFQAERTKTQPSDHIPVTLDLTF